MLCAIIAALFLLFWLAGFGRYTSVGVDSDSVSGSSVVQRYYRARWIGDGSFWVGTGQYSFPKSAHYKLKPFDWGGRFFQRSPRLIAPRSAWNRIGFWRYEKHPAAGGDPNLAPQESWIAVPGWLPVLVMTVPIFLTIRKSRRSRTTL
ncbi:MAG: hypothetical protein ABIY70_13725 [Capsulimonas sp.]|uniref:hypothetical protein n=1 Tax=Capsulimonas sp. TaxID=2494211 RepID=UPI0032651F85